MIKIVCDRCGRDIAGTPGYIAWNFRQSTGGSLTEPNIFEKCDYCKECMDDIREFIAHRPALVQPGTKDIGIPAEQPPAETSPSAADRTLDNKKGRRNSRIDIGKIMALKKAGWSTRRIADEMDMEPTAVYNAIWRHTKKAVTQ